ncbi:MAG: aspartate aminotransferase family protein [Dehalococcoidia bacterium]|jgi:acetylornithine/N-succinyldiaminopimelate aminotransferase|nr:aspartate aminotransferase family protein [Dehalococcoidia bacterium]
MSDLTDLENKYYMQVARRQPVVIVRGEGTRVWDENEKEYLDFTSGWAVNTLGHCHPALVRAVEEQARTLMQTSNQFFTVPQVKLAQILVENSCLDRVFFSNSGAEANEGVVKLARKYGKINRDGAYEVITALNSFHGRTLTMAAATGQPAYQEQWQPLAPGFTNVPYDDIDAIKEATNSKTCAVMLEPVQGEGGVNVPANDYLKQIRAWCDEQNLVMILDEVQTGIGRLGTLFGYQRFGVEPDAITLAKGLGGGVPIGAFMAKEKFCLLAPGDHGSTYGGNALTCAGAFAVVDHVVQNNVPPHANAMGQRLREGLNALASRYENINEVRGMGLLLAVQFSSDISGQLVSLCNEEGLLLNPVRPNAIRFMPPLNVSPQEIDTALERLGKALSKVVSG